MKFTTTAIFAFIAALTTAAPAPAPQGYNGFQVVVTFQGAAGAQYTEFIPADGSVYYLSKSHPPQALFGEDFFKCKREILMRKR
jgi:hypothetical protein